MTDDRLTTKSFSPLRRLDRPNSAIHADHCQVGVSNTLARFSTTKQCSRKATTERPFSDGETYPCCGLHARQYDQIASRRATRQTDLVEEQALLDRLAKLALPDAQLKYTLSGKPTAYVVISLDALEALISSK